MTVDYQQQLEALSGYSQTPELVTPDMAREYLKHNYGNRRLRPQLVAQIAREIQAGRWVANGQTVIFAKSGRLMDGQHRLEAIVRAGIAAPMMVVRGVVEGAFATLDQGAKRTVADDLRSYGVQNAVQVGAAARMVLLWTQGFPQRGANVSKTEITDFVLEHPEIADMRRPVEPLSGLMPVSPMLALSWMAQRDGTQVERFKSFLTGLTTGANLSGRSPVLALRNTGVNLQRGRTGAAMSNDTWFGLMILGWNAFARGEQRQVLKTVNWPSEIVGYPHVRKVLPLSRIEGKAVDDATPATLVTPNKTAPAPAPTHAEA